MLRKAEISPAWSTSAAGRKIYLECRGTGAPTVVLVADSIREVVDAVRGGSWQPAR
jgi:hypothetical protein